MWYAQSDHTIVVMPGTYIIPEYWYINVGIDQSDHIDSIAIRGATGNYDDVIIKGTSPGMTGASSFGFFIHNGSNVPLSLSDG